MSPRAGMASGAPWAAFSGVTSSNREGRTTREAASARKIMMAVRNPKDENMGMGAKSQDGEAHDTGHGGGQQGNTRTVGRLLQGLHLGLAVLPNSSRNRSVM